MVRGERGGGGGGGLRGGVMAVEGSCTEFRSEIDTAASLKLRGEA